MLLVGLGLTVSCGPSAFQCSEDTECTGDGGACVDGSCAFPDDACPSGLKFAKHSGSRSGECVPPDTVADTDRDADGDAGSSTASSTDTTASASDPTLGPTTDDPTETSNATAASTGEPFGPVEFVDDELIGEFEDGTFNRLEYVEGRVRIIDGDPGGTFVSRVFDAGAGVEWQTLSWQPDGPYAKPLPDERQAESGYVDGIDMAGNILLMHFDEPGVLGPGTLISDGSGRGNDGSILSEGADSEGIPGLFGLALDDNPEAYVSIPAGLPDFDFGTEPFTWAMWFRYGHDCPTNNVFMGIEDIVGGGDGAPHLWMGCTISAWDECPSDVEEPRPAGVLRSEQGNDAEGVFYCGPGGLNDDTWHHMAIVKNGHASATVDLFVDGRIVQSVVGTFASPIDMDTHEGDFGLGGFSGSTYPSQGVFDDAAIWTRALGEDEVRAIYRRGALSLQVEVRVCEMDGCADEPAFVGGPNLESGVAFTDPAQALSPGSEVSIAGLPAGRYAQYRLTFATDAPDLVSPALASVTMAGEYASP